MDETEIYEKTKAAIVDQLGVDEKNVSKEISLKDLGADSLDEVELTMVLEEAFDIEIEPGDQDKLQTIGDIAGYILKRKND